MKRIIVLMAFLMSFSVLNAQIDSVEVSTPNSGSGTTIREAFKITNQVIDIVNLLELYNVTGSLNYDTENYNATGTGDIVLSIGATLTTVSITDVIKLTPTADAPSGATEGMIYADTDHHLYYYNGSIWVQIDN